MLRRASFQGIYKIRRFTPARLTSVSANRLEASVQGPWTSWDLHTRQGWSAPDCRQRTQTYIGRRQRELVRCWRASFGPCTSDRQGAQLEPMERRMTGVEIGA